MGQPGSFTATSLNCTPPPPAAAAAAAAAAGTTPAAAAAAAAALAVSPAALGTDPMWPGPAGPITVKALQADVPWAPLPHAELLLLLLLLQVLLMHAVSEQEEGVVLLAQGNSMPIKDRGTAGKAELWQAGLVTETLTTCCSTPPWKKQHERQHGLKAA